MALTSLHNQGGIRGEEASRLGDQRAVGVQPVGAAIERSHGIVIPHLCRQAIDVRRADIGRVRNDQIEWADQAACIIARDERRAIRQPCARCIGPGGLQGALRNVGPESLRRRQLGQQRQQDRAGAGAEIGDAQWAIELSADAQ